MAAAVLEMVEGHLEPELDPLDHLMAGRTSFVIAQRISTVRNADMILLLDGGKIAAQGKHDDLLRESALYGEIIDSQFGGDRVPEPALAA